DIEHTRHRNPINFMVNMVAGLIRYTYFEKKPSTNFSQKDRDLLLLNIGNDSINNDFMGFLIEGNSHQSKPYFLFKSLVLGIYRLSILFTINKSTVKR
ncbi:MAG: hypothetical protein KAU90_10545, partial [Sulfurovaceae bacterium]|nr:hypothetical protein [Sulfurovaceae bacterium]